MRMSKPYARLSREDMETYEPGYCIFLGYDAREDNDESYDVISAWTIHELKVQAADNRDYASYKKLRNIEDSVDVVDNLIARHMIT